MSLVLGFRNLRSNGEYYNAWQSLPVDGCSGGVSGSGSLDSFRRRNSKLKPPGSRWGEHEHNLHIRMPSYLHQRLVDRQNDGDYNDFSGALAPHTPP